MDIGVTDSPEDVGFYSGLVESTVTGEQRHQRTFKMENTEANQQRRRADFMYIASVVYYWKYLSFRPLTRFLIAG